MNRKYTEKDEELIRRLYPTHDVRSLAFRLGVGVKALRQKAKVMGLRRNGYVKRQWKDRQVRYLIKHYADTPMEVLVEKTKHTACAVYQKAKKLGLKKDREYFVSVGRYCSAHPKSVATRFKKGNEPFNKGMRLEEFMSAEGIERSSRTRFKKGQAPHNLRPVGYERIDKKDGYVFIKVEMGRKMVLKHRWVWEQAHGKIPKGYIVTFIDGNRQNCELENLKLMSVYENGLRHFLNESPEKRAVRARKAYETRQKSIRLDRARIHFGMEPLGRLVKRW